MNILLMEDNPPDVRLVKEMLADASQDSSFKLPKFQLTQVDRLKTGINMLSTQVFDLILIDLRLPDSEGLETVKTVCSIASKTPIIVLSGHTDEIIAVQALQEGAQDYLLKGNINSAILIRAIYYAIERKKIDSELKHLAYFDHVTGLANRAHFTALLYKMLMSANRYKEKVAVLFIDLDHFKLVNDKFGHDAGDILLKKVARRFINHIRAADMVARLGGDEFSIALSKTSSVEDVVNFANKLISVIKRPIVINGDKVAVTASIGISIFPEHGSGVKTLLKHADIAMYRAKKKGRNNFQLFTAGKCVTR